MPEATRARSTPTNAPGRPVPFETLLSGLAVRLINLGAEEVQAAIEEGLRLTGRFAGADEVRLLTVEGGSLGHELAYAWLGEGARGDLACSTPDFFERFPVAARMLRAGRPMVYAGLHELPPEAQAERDYLADIGLLAAIAQPIMVDGRLIAVLFIHCFRETRWPPELLAQLPQVASIFGNALARRRAETRLQAQLRFETLLAEVSAGFVNPSPEDIDAEIDGALAKIGTLFAADRVFIVRFSRAPTGTEGALTLGWAAPGVPRTDPHLNGRLFDESFPWITARLREGRVFVLPMDEFPAQAVAERNYVRKAGIASSILLPLTVGGIVGGAVILDSFDRHRRWDRLLAQRLRVLGEIIASALQRKQDMAARQAAEQDLTRALAQVRQLKERLEAENLLLREEIELHQSHEALTGDGQAMRQLKSRIERVAPTGSTVLILGETGSGKELVANALHRLSGRRDRPLIKVNCAALPETLIEAELFGREKGAYTGALTRQIGRFEVADGATLFLDEIGELPPALQGKLLRVLQDGGFERLGSTRTQHVDVRLIAATNRDLDRAVAEGRFREDLYYRLNVFPIRVPPLRERPEDIPALVWRLIGECCAHGARTIRSVPGRDMARLQTYAWPGNVRELRNLIERALILSDGPTLRIDLPGPASPPTPEEAADERLEAIERAHIRAILARTGWRIRGERGAAAILGLKPTTLEYRIKKLGLKRP
ncbi:MAG: sigma 54-interacting transcriptional regulator [Thiohalocapsa sp. PB-PSB1]|jgi:formate hydrogenlyase transcriptional activator|nr:MAG: sigma 54-interacting transcriptional regulator [Thiohalocapsa sp. PB-PSB1]